MRKIPRSRRYPMRPFSLATNVCRAFDVPPTLINHTAQPIARWTLNADGTSQAVVEIDGVGSWRFEMPAGAIQK